MNAKEPKHPKQPKQPKGKRSKLPPWLKTTGKIANHLMVPFLCLAALFVGLIIGYVYLGEQEAADVFKLQTWKHLVDLVLAD